VADDFECSGILLYDIEPGHVLIVEGGGFGSGSSYCPQTYASDDVLLDILISNAEMWVSPLVCDTSRLRADFQMVGGEWFDSVSTDGVGWTGRIGGTAGRSGEVGECFIDSAVYLRLAFLTGTFQADIPVPTTKVSWAEIKARF
jgi:hypothetical protein